MPRVAAVVVGARATLCGRAAAAAAGGGARAHAAARVVARGTRDGCRRRRWPRRVERRRASARACRRRCAVRLWRLPDASQPHQRDRQQVRGRTCLVVVLRLSAEAGEGRANQRDCRQARPRARYSRRAASVAVEVAQGFTNRQEINQPSD
eukprot:99380-Chlamydomonas_euryale.AAC.2